MIKPSLAVPNETRPCHASSIRAFANQEESTARVVIGHKRTVARRWINPHHRTEETVCHHYAPLCSHSETFREYKAWATAQARPRYQGAVACDRIYQHYPDEESRTYD